jgi:hypothetical protein
MNTTTLNMTTLDGGNVIIKKGGGGGDTPSGGGDWRYFKFGENSAAKNIILSSLATTVKGGYEGESPKIVFSFGTREADFIVSAFAFFADAYVTDFDGNKIKAGEAYANILGMLPNYGVEAISEEEFYTLD